MTALLAGSAYAADLPARHMPVKAPVAVPYYNWTGLYLGVNAGYAWGRIGTVAGNENLNGFAGGAQIGYNWQVNNFVFGLEADFQGSSQKSSASGIDPVLGAWSASDRIRYFGTIRGRLGVAQDRWLVYVTGGYAYQNVAIDVATANFGGFSDNQTKGGWTVGGGLEYAFAGPWTAGIEYLYLDSGNRDWTLGGVTTSARVKNNVVRAKLNYRF